MTSKQKDKKQKREYPPGLVGNPHAGTILKLLNKPLDKLEEKTSTPTQTKKRGS